LVKVTPQASSAHDPPLPDLDSRSFSTPPVRSQLATLYLRVADTLERSGELAERHAQYEESRGRTRSGYTELERAKRARAGAQHARALASRQQLQEPTVATGEIRAAD
jgi:hypothetical protein